MTPSNRRYNRVNIIANPVSGRGQAREIGQHLQNKLARSGYNSHLHVTEQPGDAKNWAAEQEGDDAIVSVGGDGTIREIVNGIDLSNPPVLTIFPTGTGNVMAGELRLRPVADRLVTILQQGTVRWMDVGQYGSNRFLCMAGFGFDASVVNSFHAVRDQQTGMNTYVNVGFSELFSLGTPHLNVYVDETLQTRNASFVQIANTRNYGGPLLFSPGARPDDGRFDVSWLETTGTQAVFRLMLSALLGVPTLNPDYRTVQGRSVRVESLKKEPNLQLDGDPVEVTDNTFRVLPRAVPFLTPLSVSRSKR